MEVNQNDDVTSMILVPVPVMNLLVNPVAAETAVTSLRTLSYPATLQGVLDQEHVIVLMRRVIDDTVDSSLYRACSSEEEAQRGCSILFLTVE